MSRYDDLMQRIDAGERILIDGATGTEIERRGVPMIDNAWNGGGALTHPDTVRSVHEDYIGCGAQIIISNTFSTSRHVLQDAKMAHHFEFLNRRGIELAREARRNARADNVLVAGGITHLSFTGNHPSLDQLRRNVDDQAAVMAKADADLIMLEMMDDVERLLAIVDSAQASELPVWVGFSCRPDEQGMMRLLAGPPLLEGLDACADRNVPLISIMHTEVDYVNGCLDVVEKHWSQPVGVYAHSGKFVAPNWIFDGVISPDAYADAAQDWLARGVNVIGGCCGIGLEHIEVLREVVPM